MLYAASLLAFVNVGLKGLTVDDVTGGDWKCGSGKCDTVKIARVENAGVENAGVSRMERQREIILRKP